MCSPRSDLEYHDAGARSWWVAKHLTEIAIQCNERSAFAPADFKQCLIRRSAQPLTGNRDGIVTGGADQIGRAPAQILVELEVHAAFSAGMGTICSRAASAP